MSISASSAQIAAQPVQSGNRTLRTTGNITAAAPSGSAIDVTGDTVSFTLVNTGTLDNAAVVAVQAQINGSSFFPFYEPGATSPLTFTGTQVNAGVAKTINCKALQIRFVLTPGTTTGSNGAIIRVLD